MNYSDEKTRKLLCPINRNEARLPNAFYACIYCIASSFQINYIGYLSLDGTEHFTDLDKLNFPKMVRF